MNDRSIKTSSNLNLYKLTLNFVTIVTDPICYPYCYGFLSNCQKIYVIKRRKKMMCYDAGFMNHSNIGIKLTGLSQITSINKFASSSERRTGDRTLKFFVVSLYKKENYVWRFPSVRPDFLVGCFLIRPRFNFCCKL